MSAARIQAMRDQAHELDLAFHRGDKAAGRKARALAIRAAELEAQERAAPRDCPACDGPRYTSRGGCPDCAYERTNAEYQALHGDTVPVDLDRQALELRLRLQAPLRSKHAAQVNELDCPLFGHAAAPSLF